MEQSDLLLRAAVDQMPHAVILADAAGRIIYRNPPAEELGGPADVGELLGVDWSDLNTGCGHTTYNVEIPLECDRVLVADVWTAPLGSPGQAVLVMVSDASRRTSMARRFASERDSAVNQMAAEVAHEMSNPLDGVLRYVGLARRVGGTQAESYLASAQEGLQRMAIMARNLIDRSRPGGAHTDSVGHMVAQAVTAMRPRADALGVRVTIEGRAEQAIGRNLFQVFCNIIKNALDAMPSGGELAIDMHENGGGCSIAFADSGRGLTAEEARRAFDPFFTTKAQEDGVGLGLAVSREIISRVEGTIEITPGVQCGATVTICLPAAATATNEAQPTARSV